MKTKLFALMILALLMPIGSAYAWGERDNSDRLSNDQAGVFSPGYINAAKQQAYSVINQNNQSKSWWESLVDKVKDKMANKVEEQGNTKVQPEVKKKTSAGTKISNISSTKTSLIDSSKLNVSVGSGTEQHIVDGVLLGEKIGDTWYAYLNNGSNTFIDQDGHAAGFLSLNEGLGWLANEKGGGYAIMRKGQYTGNVAMLDGIRFYGGYDAYGNRDIISNATTISGTINVSGATESVEINGFNINGNITASNCSDVTIINNIITGAGGSFDYGITGKYSNLIINNNIMSGFARCINTEKDKNESGKLTNWSISLSGNTFNILSTGAYIYGSSTTASLTSQDNNYNFVGWVINPIGLRSVSPGTISSNNDYFSPSIELRTYTAAGRGRVPIVTNPQTQPTSKSYDIKLTSLESFDTPVTNTTTNALSSNYWKNLSNSNIYGTYGSSPYEALTNIRNSNLSSSMVSGILKGLLANKNALQTGTGTPLNEAVIGRLVTETLSSSVGVPSLMATEGRIPDMQIALALANILKNPTEDQKAVLDAVEALLLDMKNVQEKAGANPELNKAESDLLQMVASVLLAQGVPDLLKAGDIEGVRGIFKDLGRSKDSIMLDYNDSIKPYYNSIVKDLTANFAILQLKGMLSRKITEEELKNLEPREIDRLIENIRKANDKSFELQYILQQDAKYRKSYLDPSNKALEEAMKTMLNSFTRRISEALEDKK